MIEEYGYEQGFEYDFRMIIFYDTFGPFVPWWYQYYMNILWWAEFFLISLWFPIDSPNLSEYHRESFLLRICSDHNIRIRSLTFEPAIASLKSPVNFQEVYLVSSNINPHHRSPLMKIRKSWPLSSWRRPADAEQCKTSSSILGTSNIFHARHHLQKLNNGNK